MSEESILIPFKGMQIEAESKKIGDAIFFQVTNTHKLVSNDKNKKPSLFLINNNTRKFML